jgi:hypothetical protein
VKRLESRYILAQPPRRPLKIFASDPMLGRTAGNRITVDVTNESLRPGPQGARLEVIDYDGAHQRFYPPVNLDDPAILMGGGLDPTESDPRFHQQMVYAVAMRTIENFDRALGRTVELHQRGYPRLRLLPHAFHGANAFYDRDLHALLFGYFRADPTDPGANLPGQNVFTCLSHDIIAHEMTHALVDRLRRYFLEPSNEDVLAFHEGFADIVALFQHFSFQELLREQIQRTRTDIRTPTLLVELARQFGYATGTGRALRSALDKPDAKLYRAVTEPHARGSILVAAVFDAFFNIYQQRIRDLIRIATGGTGNLPAGDLHPDLVNRVATEASRTAQSILTMCIRAFDYLPPVDITFGDYLRALVTADYELVPDDEYGQRSAVIEAFRLRGIYPENVASLAEESLLWANAERDVPPIPVETLEMLRELTFAATSFSQSPAPWPAWGEAEQAATSRRQRYAATDEGGDTDLSAEMAQHLHAYASANAERLLLDPGRPIAVRGFHSVFRVAPNGRLLIELVAQFAQQDRSQAEALGGIPARGGTTVIASANGDVRYIIAKPLWSSKLDPAKQREAAARLDRQKAYVALCDLTDANLAYAGDDYPARRMALRMNLSALHQGAF